MASLGENGLVKQVFKVSNEKINHNFCKCYGRELQPSEVNFIAVRGIWGDSKLKVSTN